MIEGLKLDFSAEELEKHLATRIEHHQQRVQWHRKRLDELRAAMAEDDPQLDKTNNSNRGIVSTEESKIAEHAQRTKLLDVIRTHLQVGEIYRLEESDLIKLELIPRIY